jgi:serine phosphatase RsbU (regulator of sigma subunit)
MSWMRKMPAPERGDLLVVQRFAEHAAVALAQAQRAQAQQDVAALYRRFQASLSPVVSVQTPQLKVATYYRPGEGRMLLGGDFIDAVTRPNGSVAAVIGDVTGHGPDAAALGASLRAAWRALALRGASLQASMKTLNSLTLDESDRAEQGELGLGLLATVCAVEIDAAGRRARFVVAGHPMPLLCGQDVIQVEHTPGMMLGVEQYGDWPPHEVTLPPDWGLLLFSDGIVEARTGSGPRDRLGVDGLRQAVADLWHRHATTSADLKGLVDGVQAGYGTALADDVTLLLLSHDGSAPARGHAI